MVRSNSGTRRIYSLTDLQGPRCAWPSRALPSRYPRSLSEILRSAFASFSGASSTTPNNKYSPLGLPPLTGRSDKNNTPSPVTAPLSSQYEACRRVLTGLRYRPWRRGNLANQLRWLPSKPSGAWRNTNANRGRLVLALVAFALDSFFWRLNRKPTAYDRGAPLVCDCARVC